MEHRIGIYSGTFDPVHPGHIAFAQEAMRVCDLDEVLFLPEQKPRGKEYITDISHRAALIECAVKATPGLRVVQLASKQFNVEETLPELRRMFGKSHLTLLLGSDVVRTFLYRWEGLDVLLSDVSLAIGLRIGDSSAEVTTIINQLAHDYNISIDYSLISTQEADMTSSEIRNGTADMSRLAPDTLAYIQEHQLYVRQI